MGLDASAMEESPNGRERMNKVLLGLTGLAVLILGLVLLVKFWPQTVILFKAVVGVLVAVTGLVMMSVARD